MTDRPVNTYATIADLGKLDDRIFQSVEAMNETIRIQSIAINRLEQRISELERRIPR